MKNSLISTSVAVLLASNSIVTFASSVTIPNTFTAGTTAVAADVNANFDAVAVGVNDNDSRITTNTNTIGTNTTAIGTNTTNITTNTADIATNAADIAALQGGSSCPTDMVASGPLCVDKYEASVWNDPTAGTQLGIASDDYACNNDGSDCGAGAAVPLPIYARSVAGVTPSSFITLYQAAQACANVGKRLPTTTEWQTAASGTPSGTGDGTTGCNSANTNTSVGVTGAAASCVSSTGAFDMVGNLWEWVADLDTAGGTFSSTDSATARMLGDDWFNSTTSTPSTKSMLVLSNSGGGFDFGPNSGNDVMGFRCVR